jgi:hypothetical protein
LSSFWEELYNIASYSSHPYFSSLTLTPHILKGVVFQEDFSLPENLSD